MRLHRHKCTHVGKRFEHRPLCTTPVVRRCSRSIRCRNCPTHWGIRCKWFYPQCSGKFLPSNLGMLRCRRSLIYRLDKSLRLLGPIGNTLLALECMSSHWMPVGRNQNHNLCRFWNRKSQHTFRVRIQCTQWILVWWRRIREGKRFHWRLHLGKNVLLCMFEVCHSNCRIRVAPHCMLSNVRLCCQSQLGIQGTWCCRTGLGTTQCYNLDTIHCGWNQRLGSFYQPHSGCTRLDWLHQ